MCISLANAGIGRSPRQFELADIHTSVYVSEGMNAIYDHTNTLFTCCIYPVSLRSLEHLWLRIELTYSCSVEENNVETLNSWYAELSRLSQICNSLIPYNTLSFCLNLNLNHIIQLLYGREYVRVVFVGLVKGFV